MANRTTAADVGKVIEVETDIDLDPFITAANSLVTELCVSAGYAADRLKLIETWLAAHFYAIRDPRLASETAGGAGGSYQGQTAMNLSATTYGQQAMVLDTSGTLSALNVATAKGKKPSACITWLGTAKR